MRNLNRKSREISYIYLEKKTTVDFYIFFSIPLFPLKRKTFFLSSLISLILSFANEMFSSTYSYMNYLCMYEYTRLILFYNLCFFPYLLTLYKYTFHQEPNNTMNKEDFFNKKRKSPRPILISFPLFLYHLGLLHKRIVIIIKKNPTCLPACLGIHGKIIYGSINSEKKVYEEEDLECS